MGVFHYNLILKTFQIYLDTNFKKVVNSFRFDAMKFDLNFGPAFLRFC